MIVTVLAAMISKALPEEPLSAASVVNNESFESDEVVVVNCIESPGHVALALGVVETVGG